MKSASGLLIVAGQRLPSFALLFTFLTPASSSHTLSKLLRRRARTSFAARVVSMERFAAYLVYTDDSDTLLSDEALSLFVAFEVVADMMFSFSRELG